MIAQDQDSRYARLPEDLLHDLLGETGHIADDVARLLDASIEHREQLRQGLRDLGLLRRFTPTELSSVAAVDGGFAIERTLAVDLILSVAVGVEGMGAQTPWGDNQYVWWPKMLPHQIESERLARGVMVAQELAIIAEAPHTLRILDGSHLTLVIQLNSALTVQSGDIRSLAKERWGHHRTATALKIACEDPAIVAMPKYDSSREIAKQLSTKIGMDIPGDDKYLLSMLLEKGEFTSPQRVPSEPWSQLHFDARSGDEAIAQSFGDAIRPLVQREVLFTYVKATDSSPAYRLEIKADARDDLDQICSTLASQITGPFVREPYPQYLADVMAKSVGLGLSALQAAVQFNLSARQKPGIARMLLSSYRTEGV